MLALAILSTIFLGLSCITALIKNEQMLPHEDVAFIGWTVYSLLWRSLAIVSIWVLFYA